MRVWTPSSKCKQPNQNQTKPKTHTTNSSITPSPKIFTYSHNIPSYITRASLVAQTVKNLPLMQEAQVPSLGWEDPLEKEMAPHSNILTWRIPWTEKPGGLYGPWGRKESDMTSN